MPTDDETLKEKENKEKHRKWQRLFRENRALTETPEERTSRMNKTNKKEDERRKARSPEAKKKVHKQAYQHKKDKQAQLLKENPTAAVAERARINSRRRKRHHENKAKKATEEQATGCESNDSRELLTSDNRSVGPARPEGPTYSDPPRQDHNATFAMTSMRSSLPPTISTQLATSHHHSSSMSDPQHSVHTSYHHSSSMSDPQHSVHTSYHHSSSMDNSEYSLYPSYQKPIANSRSDLYSTSYHNSGPRMNNNDNNPSLLASPMMPVEHESTRTRTPFASPISNYGNLSSVTNHQSSVPYNTQISTANSRSDLPSTNYYNPGPRISKNKSPLSLARGSGSRSSNPKSSGPKSSGPKSSGPKSSGPKSSGPKSSGPKSSGPKSSGPKSSGPKSFDPRSSDLTKPVRLAEHESARLRTPFAPPINSHCDSLSMTNHQPSVSHNTQIQTAYSGYDPALNDPAFNNWCRTWVPKQDEKGNFCDEKGNLY